MEFFSFHECKWKLSTGVIASFYPIAFSPECKINIKLLKPENFKKSQLQLYIYSQLFLSHDNFYFSFAFILCFFYVENFYETYNIYIYV